MTYLLTKKTNKDKQIVKEDVEIFSPNSFYTVVMNNNQPETLCQIAFFGLLDIDVVSSNTNSQKRSTINSIWFGFVKLLTPSSKFYKIMLFFSFFEKRLSTGERENIYKNFDCFCEWEGAIQKF